MLGRINASNEFLVQGVAPFGAIIAGLIATLTSARFVLLLAACGILSSVVGLLFSSIRSVDQFTTRDQI